MEEQNLQSLFNDFSALSASLTAASISSSANLDDKLSSLDTVSAELSSQLVALQDGMAGVVVSARRELDTAVEELRRGLREGMVQVR